MVKVKTRRNEPSHTLKTEVKEVLERLKGVGSNLTFEGEYAADFIERLDKLVEVEGVKMDGRTLKILVGEAKTATPTDILSVIAKGTLMNVEVAGYEDTPYGKMLYFDYYLPPWNETYIQ